MSRVSENGFHHIAFKIHVLWRCCLHSHSGELPEGWAQGRLFCSFFCQSPLVEFYQMQERMNWVGNGLCLTFSRHSIHYSRLIKMCLLFRVIRIIGLHVWSKNLNKNSLSFIDEGTVRTFLMFALLLDVGILIGRVIG